MKLSPLLVFSCCSIVVLSESTESTKQALLARASAQLERLAPYRRTSTSYQRAPDKQRQLLENVAKDPGIEILSDQRAFEIYKILPEDLQQDIANKIGGNRAMIEFLANSKYTEDRIKRSGIKRDAYETDGYESPPEGYPHQGYPPQEYPPQEYGGYVPEPYADQYGTHPQGSGSDSSGIIKGSSSLITGIAKGIIGGLVSASGSASKGSSSISASSSQSSAQSSAQTSSTSSSSDGYNYNRPKPEYGPVYSVTM